MSRESARPLVSYPWAKFIEMFNKSSLEVFVLVLCLVTALFGQKQSGKSPNPFAAIEVERQTPLSSRLESFVNAWVRIDWEAAWSFLSEAEKKRWKSKEDFAQWDKLRLNDFKPRILRL